MGPLGQSPADSVERLLGNAVGLYREDATGPGLVASVIGALIVLGIYRLAVRRRRLT